MTYYCISFVVEHPTMPPFYERHWRPLAAFFQEEDAKKYCWEGYDSDYYTEYYGCPEVAREHPILNTVKFSIVRKDEDDERWKNQPYHHVKGYFYSSTTIETQSFVVFHEYDHKEGGAGMALIEYEPNQDILEWLERLIEKSEGAYYRIGGDNSEYTLRTEKNERVSFYTAFEMARLTPLGYSYYGTKLFMGKGHWQPLREYMHWAVQSEATASIRRARPYLKKLGLYSELFDLVQKEVENPDVCWKNEEERDEFIQSILYKNGMENFFSQSQNPEKAYERIHWWMRQ